MSLLRRLSFLSVAAGAALACDAAAAEPSVQEQIDALKARIQDLETKQQAQPRVDVSPADKGFVLTSSDAENALRVRGMVQVDSRWFFDKSIDNDAFIVRRARIGLEGKLARTTEYQVVGEYAGATATLLDANVTLNLAPELQLKFGRFKTAVGMEQVQSDLAGPFIERSFVSQLIPNRDIGVQLAGDFLDHRVSYAAGLFNGTIDGGSNTTQTDGNDGKNVAARVLFQPWAQDKSSFLAGLSFGLGGTYALEDANGALAPGFKTDGQQSFYAYRTAGAAGTATAVTPNGKVWRLTPQVSYYRGPLGLIAEFVTSASDVKAVNTTTATSVVNSTRTLNLKNHAWQVEVGYVLTGEDASFKGVAPAKDFDQATGAWGAVEVVGRVASIRFDDQAFVGAANEQLVDPAKSARSADTLGAGVNWYLNKLVRLSLDYEYTRFHQATGAAAPAATSVISHPEHVVLTRFSLSF
jgi:phosphate-selective porin OprO/OprP